jgi:hypothetical protein
MCINTLHKGDNDDNNNNNNNNSNNRSVQQIADKCGFVRRSKGLLNSNTGLSHTNEKLHEIYFEAAKHR